MTENLLGQEASPYLLQHKDNPVHWRPWGSAALAEAKRENKPVLLSVGYAACHWCHVMAHESFEDPAIADLMNRLFVNIKVDREERPDVDQIYMAALHELGEQGGWPLTMFLTPDGEPIWGGTYFPPASRYGRPGFPDVLKEVARIFREEPDKVENNRKLLKAHLSKPPAAASLTLDGQLLDSASSRLLDLMDRESGGIRGAPKFPQASLLELLWRAGERTGESAYRDIVLTTLRMIAAGGIYDHVGGGFARYSVDSRWLVPHFEKMLYDNAQLIEHYAIAHVATGNDLFRMRIEETIAWLEREMVVEDGVYAASLDADSEGHEGRFYVWTHAEVLDVLGPEDGAFFAAAYDITPAGNWEGVSIPNRLAHPTLADAETERRLAEARAKLLARRETRVRPARDDKVLTDWNALTIAGLATAGALVDRREWIELAARTYRRLVSLMSVDDRLAHAYRAGKTVFPGIATDYAALIKAALALRAATLENSYLIDAQRFSEMLRAHHWDAAHPGYFLSADDADALIVRPRSNVDEATPSANALMGVNLMRFWRLTGKDAYRRDLDDLLAASAGTIAANLFSTAGTLNALDARLNAVDVVIVKPIGSDPTLLIDVVRRHWRRNLILTVLDDTATLADTHPAAGKGAVGEKPTVYVCRGETCSLPVIESADLAKLLI
jgi:uncharacterized protein YyaL (SSP411 family)